MAAELGTRVHIYSHYLALEASSDVKHELLDGQIHAMPSATPEHAALAATINGLLFAHLRGGNCRTYDSGVRVRTPSGLSTYPDIAVICGPSERDVGDTQAITNPTLLIDVERDAGDKFEHYKTLPLSSAVRPRLAPRAVARSLDAGGSRRMAAANRSRR